MMDTFSIISGPISERVHAMMCEGDWKREQRGLAPDIWTMGEIAKHLECSRSAVGYAVDKLKPLLVFKEHWFRTEGGLVMEYYITLRDYRLPPSL